MGAAARTGALMAPSQPRQAEQGLPDADLLRAVAERRDQDAFAELYNRHEQAAYALARHMLRSPDGAEVAVQEAMLRVWRSADRYRYDKNARGWLLRIVVFECIRIQKARRAAAARTVPLAHDAPELPGAARAEHGSREEQLAGLRRCLERLPETSRQLVSLYYLAGMTQEEIGQELAMPQQTVSNRLRDALKFLRAELSQLGLAAALPLLDEGALGGALAHVYTPPAALKSGVFDALARSGAEAAAQASRALSRRAAAHAFPWPGVLAVTALAAAAGGVYLGLSPEQPRETAPGLAAEAAPELHSDAVPGDASPRTIAWSFERGQPEGFKLLENRWLKVVEKDGVHLAGAVAFRDRADAVTTLLPMRVRPRPFRVHSVLFYVPENANLDRIRDGKGTVQGGVSLGYTDGKIDMGLLDWYMRPQRRDWELDKPHTFQSDHYFIGRYIFHIMDGNLCSVKVNEAPYPTGQIYLIAYSYGVHSMEFHELEPGEIPALLREPDALAGEIKAKRDARKDGWRRYMSSGLPEQ